MTAEAFRRDKYLRAAGYNFYVWAAVNALVTVPFFSALEGAPWPGALAALYPLALVFLGLFLCGLNDNRVEKMVGPASPQTVLDAGSLWGPIFLGGIALSIVLSVRGRAALVQPLWLILVGGAYWVWGNFSVREFRWLGWALMIAGLSTGVSVELPENLDLASPAALQVWLLFMAALWVPFGAYINRKYVHSMAPVGESGAASR